MWWCVYVVFANVYMSVHVVFGGGGGGGGGVAAVCLCACMHVCVYYTICL